MNASFQIKLDRIAIERLCRLGYLTPQDRDPTSIRLAAAAALADRLAPNPELDTPMDSAEFTKRKLVGTTAESALRDLLTGAGGIVTCNQQNRDAVEDHPGAAIAHLADRTHHLPDLTVLFPSRHVARRMGIEAKAKSPLRRGGWGWDKLAFERAFRWSVLTGEPVLYAIRDLDAAPLPAPGQADDPEFWVFASVWKLMHSPTRTESGPYYYWPADDFLPLAVLLENVYDAALVPVVWLDDGPPIVL